MTTAIKILGADHRSCLGGAFDWAPYLPTRDADGAWTPGPWTPEQPVEMCRSGYHAATEVSLMCWLGCSERADIRLWHCDLRSAVVASADPAHEAKLCGTSMRLLRPLDAHTVARAWTTCSDATILLRAIGRLSRARGDDLHRGAVRAACACVRTVLHFVPAGESQPRRALEIAEAWCRGEATLGEVRAAIDARSVGGAGGAFADAVTSAAYFALDAANDDLDAANDDLDAANDAANDVANDVARAAYFAHAAAALAADDAAEYSERDRALAEMADVVRAHIPLADVLTGMEVAP